MKIEFNPAQVQHMIELIQRDQQSGRPGIFDRAANKQMAEVLIAALEKPEGDQAEETARAG